MDSKLYLKNPYSAEVIAERQQSALLTSINRFDNGDPPVQDIVADSATKNGLLSKAAFYGNKCCSCCWQCRQNESLVFLAVVQSAKLVERLCPEEDPYDKFLSQKHKIYESCVYLSEDLYQIKLRHIFGVDVETYVRQTKLY